MTEDNDEKSLRQQVADTAQAMSQMGLSPQLSGNVSVRLGSGILITPSAMAYGDMLPGDIVRVGIDGEVGAGQKRPSTETPMHLAIYRERPQAGAIVHCHSMAATALSCTRKSIPSFHYMVAVAGGTGIACADYATFGSNELAGNALKALGRRSACLLANHGQIAFADTLPLALELAEQVEMLARQFIDAMQAGEPVILSDSEMQDALKQFEHYGQGRN